MNIFQPGIADPSKEWDLTVDARLVLGIMNTCDIDSPILIAEIMLPNEASTRSIRDKEDKVRSLIRKLEESTHPVVAHALKFGLCLRSSVSILKYKNLKCAKCNQRIAKVPCGVCACHALSANRDRPKGIDLLSESVEPPEFGVATRHPPGSREKLIVMKYRKQLGQMVFCSSDL